MNELFEFKEIDWFVLLIKSLLVRKNKNYNDINELYQKSSNKKKLDVLLEVALPDYFVDKNRTNLLEEVIKAPFDDLIKIKKHIDLYKYDFSESKDWNILKKTYKQFVKYKYNIELVNKYGVRCCPYCNENFIFNRNDKAGCQLDHFFPQDKYPIFAVSINNIVPVCSTCNHIKSNNNLNISPCDHSNAARKIRSITRISYELNCLQWPYSEDSINSIFLYDDNNDDLKLIDKMNNDIAVLGLESSYKFHKDRIVDIVNKALIYNEVTLESLISTFNSSFVYGENLKKYIFGGYSEKELLNTPLSKMTRDILTELDLLEDDY